MSLGLYCRTLLLSSINIIISRLITWVGERVLIVLVLLVSVFFFFCCFSKEFILPLAA